MKFFNKTFRKISLFILLIIFCIYLFITNAWRFDFTENEIQLYVSEINKSDSLPDMFYEYYNIDTDFSLEENTLGFLAKSFFLKNQHRPISNWLANIIYVTNRKDRSFQRLLRHQLFLAIKIENEVDSKQQFNFVLDNIDFVNGQVGVKSVSKFYFNKDVNELDNIEIATIVVMLRNPSLYNPIRRPEKVKIEAEKLLKKASKNQN